ncbi:MAG TPA: ScpA family protein [Candidatus Bipolaricaulota bacterium]|nr:ScpA family protein [Candidatus Bipolaricaulota bacterium]
MYKIKIEKFSGPLDLLLQLIEGKELEITEISLSQVTDQYLEHIKKLTNKPAEELADFLVIAAKLLLFKSKAILPIVEEEVEPDELEKQLKMYKEYYEASKVIDAMMGKENFSFGREKSPIKMEVEFHPPENVNSASLKEVFLKILKRLDPLLSLPKVAIEKTISIQEKIMSLQKALSRFRNIDFSKLTKNAKSKTEIIINFLALLELIKRRSVFVSQNEIFGNIQVKKI